MASASPTDGQGQATRLTSYPPAVQAVVEFSSLSPETVLKTFISMTSGRDAARHVNKTSAVAGTPSAEAEGTVDPGLMGTQGPAGDSSTGAGHDDRHTVKAPELLQKLDSIMGGANPSWERTVELEPSRPDDRLSGGVLGDGNPAGVPGTSNNGVFQCTKTHAAAPDKVTATSAESSASGVGAASQRQHSDEDSSDLQHQPEGTTRQITEEPSFKKTKNNNGQTQYPKDYIPTVNNGQSLPQPKEAARQMAATSAVGKKTRTKSRQTYQSLKEKLLALKAENRRLKARQMCRGCGQRPASLTLLPCGHYCYCETCASSFTVCPLCARTILADVKTFLC